ncbi:MAG: hypothetical protein ACT4PW_05130 [Acidimicrobiia bacterium]
MVPSRSPCDNCGAWLPSASSRCPSCGRPNGPDEWVGRGPVEGARPGGDVRRHRRGSRDAVVLAAIAVVCIGALVVAGSGEEGQAAPPPTTSAPPVSKRPAPTLRPPSSTSSTSSTTSTSLPTAMVPSPLALGEPSGIALIVATESQTFVADLDAGTRAPLDRRTGLFYPGSTMVARAGGMAVATSGRVRFLVPPYSSPGVDLPGLREDGSILASSHPDRVWLVQATASGVAVQEASVDGTVTVPEFALPGDGYPSAAVSDGLVFTMHGSIYVVGGDDITALGPGDVLAAGGDTVVAVACDERARCGLFAIDATSGDRRRLGDYRSDFMCCGWAISPAGSFMAGTRDTVLDVVDLATGVTRSVDLPGAGYASGTALSWSADGRFVFGNVGESVFAYEVGQPSAQALFTTSNVYTVVAVEASPQA